MLGCEGRNVVIICFITCVMKFKEGEWESAGKVWSGVPWKGCL